MNHYHFPPEVSDLVMTYFSKIKMRFSMEKKVTHWQTLQKAIMAGYTAMNVIIKAVELECKGRKSLSGVRHPRAGLSWMTSLQ